jgi:hypothetical protein
MAGLSILSRDFAGSRAGHKENHVLRGALPQATLVDAPHDHDTTKRGIVIA